MLTRKTNIPFLSLSRFLRCLSAAFSLLIFWLSVSLSLERFLLDVLAEAPE